MLEGKRQKSGLTAAWVSRAKPKDKPYKLSDRDGLDLQIEPSGLRGRIEKVLGAATVLGLRSGHNPAAWRGNLEHLLGKQRKGPKRHQPAMPYAEVPPFLTALRDQHGVAAQALDLLIHTATRTSEVLKARWNEFDLANQVWTIPAERMKAGKVHRVPLTPQVMKLLQGLPRQQSFLFPGQSKGTSRSPTWLC